MNAAAGAVVKNLEISACAKSCKLQVAPFLMCALLASFSCHNYAEVTLTALNDGDIVVLTHADVKTGELNLNNLRAIFSIRKRSWDNKIPIKVYVLPDKNEIHQKFCKTILKVYPYVLREQWDRLIFSGTGIPPTTVDTEEELQEMVNATPGAIGYAIVNSPVLASNLEIRSPTVSVIESAGSAQ
ncbi:hypothetical protein [Zhongshania sp.]|uniref:hypothetical protein n=1 Tax=Zhongshania sp. TaxID=1971902 RepID=UPI0039E6D583